MIKRVMYFVFVNFLVLVTIGVILNVLGVQPYLTSQGINFGALLTLAAIVGFSGALISLALSRLTAKWLTGARVLDPLGRSLSPTERRLISTVERLARQAGLSRTPEVAIYEDDEVNAFATGPTRNHALVAVSTGLLGHLDDQAVEGVLAHEVAHVANGDMVTMALLQGVINTFVIVLSRAFAYVVSRFVREELQPFVHWIAVLVFDVLFSILGSLVVMYFSRMREYQADQGGATLAGRAQMIHALESIKRWHEPIESRPQPALATYKIASSSSGWLKLFASHPDIDERIARLKAGA
jgi:heat shock protein HtpX